MIFVFGSNLRGRHGAGAARFAAKWHGAAEGVGKGHTGNAYAIPTKDRQIQTLDMGEIATHVFDFLDYAKEHPDLKFMVTRVGCGLAGHPDSLMASMFKTATKNVYLPGRWYTLLRPDLNIQRIIIAGGRNYTDYAHMEKVLDEHLDLTPQTVIVSGKAKGADKLGEEYAEKRSLKVQAFPAHWDFFGKAAGHIRNQNMSWFSTHAMVFWDKVSRGSKNMIDTAYRDKLKLQVFNY